MDVFIACSCLVRGEIIEEFFWDWGGRTCEDFSLCANLWGDRDWKGDADLSLEFWDLRAVGRDSGSILWGDQNWRDDPNLMCFALRQIDAPSLGDKVGVAQFDSPGDLDRDVDPSLDVDCLTSDLKPISDSDSPRDPGWLVGDSVLGHAFGARDE